MAHSGVFMYHFPDGDDGGGWQAWDWNVMTNATLYHDGATVNSAGQFTDMGGFPDTSLQQQLKSHNASYHLCLVGDWEGLLGNTSGQNTLFSNTANVLKNTGAQGVNLDFEGMDSSFRSAYTTFVTNFANYLHNLGFKLSLAVSIDINGWPGGLDDLALSKVSDGLFYMGYDINWGNQQAYANAPLPDVESYIQSSLNAGVASNKIILGVPWYGYTYDCNTATPNTACVTNTQWPEPAYCYAYHRDKASQYGSKWDSKSSTPYWEQVSGNKRTQGWFDDPQSTTLKYQYAKSKNLLGVGTWYCGCGDGDKDLWAALNNF